MAETNLPQLSPPEVTYFNEVKNSIGIDFFVNVGDLTQLRQEISGFVINPSTQARRA
ncbi:hypothetical protein [Peribacillus kribbensis]|uniref:hypothetical protein n=1 Tax=Peribacillus kribbensis TaxID=356658 RepID=UPI0012DEB423|nr:hypothetical protein [Peribacillus kribbensis]